MPLIAIAEDFDHSLTAKLTGENYRWKFKGTSNNRNDRARDIYRSGLCYKRGQSDPYVPGAIITSVKVKRFDDTDPAPYWSIVINSTTDFEEVENPLDQEAEIEWYTSQYEEFTAFNRKGKAILNAAGDVVLMPKESSRWILRVSKNLRRIPLYVKDFNNAINKGTITVDGVAFEKRSLMCKNMRISKKQRAKVGNSEIEYRKLKYELHYKRGGWLGSHPNVGFNEIVEGLFPAYDRSTGRIKLDSAGKVVMVSRKEKRRIKVGTPPEVPQQPQVLDSNGRLITNPKEDDLLDIEAELYDELNFSQLPRS